MLQSPRFAETGTAVRLILVRHGETEANRLGKIQGVGPAPLNEKGRAQAAAVAEALESEVPFALYSSPLPRALQTADAVAVRIGATVTRIAGLIEMDVGEFDGMAGSELRERYPEVMRMWDQDAPNAVMPGGESLTIVRDRACRAVAELASQHGSEKVVAVTHNFTIQTILCTALEIPLRNFRALRVDLGSMTRLDVSESRTVQVSANETWHLKNLAI